MKAKFARIIGLGAASLIMAFSPLVFAAQSNSSHYSVDEVYFGTGGELNACSTNYCSKQAAGETAVGASSSTNYKTQAGFNTDRAPSLTFIVTGTTTDLGVLTAGTPVMTSATFSVKSYLAGGYVVQTASDPPTNTLPNKPMLHALTTPTASSPGTEQFGINLAANTSPATIGAVPAQIPNSTFSFGAAASGYNTLNLYKYVKGDTIAQSTKSSGETDYTISYLFNISTITAAGQYQFNQVLVATSTF